MAIEARMTCSSKLTHPPSGTHTWESEDGTTGRTVQLQQNDVVMTAYVGADDDKTKEWAVWTPSATLEMVVMNPDAAKYFEPGEHYRVVITKMQPQQARS